MRQQHIRQIEKIVVNIGVGKLRHETQFEDKILPEVIRELSLITGQKPATRQAKKSIAGFKIRTGDIVGLTATLRGKRKEDFFKRLVAIVIPRTKDFRGIGLNGIDRSGNLNLGLREQFVFPEINADISKVRFGLEITLVPRERNRETAIDLYRELGVPLKK